MSAGSTTGFRSTLSTLSSKLPYAGTRTQSLTLSARRHCMVLALPLYCKTSSTLRYPKRMLEERKGPACRDASSLSTHLSSRPASRPHYLGRPSVLPVTLPADDTNQLIGIVSDTQNQPQHEHALHISQPSKALGRTKRKCPALRRRALLWILLTAKTPDQAWPAYQELVSRQAAIPPHSLHNLARLLASIKPRTRTVHLQLLSVLETLERNHGRLRLHEWNTLIDSAAKQWHKTRLEDYENALNIFNKRGILPLGDTVSADGMVDTVASPGLDRQTPDIWTYTILLSIAARSNLPLAVRHASSLLRASGLTPNRYTYLCLFRYFAVRNDLGSVRSTLHKMKQQGLEVGLDGINACLWAYARNGRFDVALRIYHVLRSNVKPTPNPVGHDVEEDSHYIRDALGLDMPDGLEPDEVTYTMMIQTLAYHGDLKNALGVFVDMLSTPDRKTAHRAGDASDNPPCFKPSMAAFRALFLGFSRHGRDVDHHTVDAQPIAVLFPSSQVSWGQDALDTVFAAFLQLPNHPKPTNMVIYWILVAFGKTNGNDHAKLRNVWTKLEAKYGGGWGGRLEEIRRTIFASGDVTS